MPPPPEEIRRQLDRVLASAPFVNATRLSRFLKFVVEQGLKGDGERLKEYVIGIEVFDRDPSYDPRLDSIVRVEAGRLRGKLDEYYHGVGGDDAVTIRLPKGSYSPLFEERTAAAVASAAAPPREAAAQAPVEPPAARPVRRRLPVGAAAAAAFLAVAAWWLWPGAPDARPAIAVLPFTPASQSETDRAIAERLTEAVTAALVRLDVTPVVSSTTARAVAARRGTSDDVARELDVQFLLEARMLAEPGSVRVEMRLVDGSNNYKLAVATLRGEAADLDALAENVAAAAAAALEPRLQAPASGPAG